MTDRVENSNLLTRCDLVYLVNQLVFFYFFMFKIKNNLKIINFILYKKIYIYIYIYIIIYNQKI